MAVFYNFMCWAIVLLFIASTLLIFAARFYAHGSPDLCANESPNRALRKELECELENAKKRRGIYGALYYILSSISIIGGIIISTVYFKDVFGNEIGVIGLFILLSTLLMLFVRPTENYQQAKRDCAFLKKAEREYKCLDDQQQIINYLKGILNEYSTNKSLDSLL